MDKEDVESIYSGILVIKRSKPGPLVGMWVEQRLLHRMQSVRKRKNKVYINTYVWNLKRWWAIPYTEQKQ